MSRFQAPSSVASSTSHGLRQTQDFRSDRPGVSSAPGSSSCFKTERPKTLVHTEPSGAGLCGCPARRGVWRGSGLSPLCVRRSARMLLA